MKVGGFWFLTPFSTIFQLYHSIGGGKQSTQRKTKTSCKSLTNFITKCCIEYTTPWAGFELKVSVVIGTDCTGNCKSNYHTITTTTVPFSCMNIILKCSYLKIESIEKKVRMKFVLLLQYLKVPGVKPKNIKFVFVSSQLSMCH